MATGTGVTARQVALKDNDGHSIWKPDDICLLAIVVIGLLLTAWAIAVRSRAARHFATENTRDSSRYFVCLGHWISAFLVSTSLALLAIALTDIRWGKTWREVPQKGIEVMFRVGCVSQHAGRRRYPEPIERAKQQIKDMVDEMAGDRVGLVVFAGDTRQSCR